MIRYELKDKERQACLEKALPGFAKRLHECYAAQQSDGYRFIVVDRREGRPSINDGGDRPAYWKIDIRKDDIEAVEQYDPKKWNKYPEVTPPKGILMRCEGQYRYGGKFIGAAVWCKGIWYPAEPMALPGDVTVERFRPWDEEGVK